MPSRNRPLAASPETPPAHSRRQRPQCRLFSALALLPLALMACQAAGPTKPAEPGRLAPRMPQAVFELNRGQTDGEVAFLARGRDHALFLTASELVFALPIADEAAKKAASDPERAFVEDPLAERPPLRMAVLRMGLVSAGKDLELIAEQRRRGDVAYYSGTREDWVNGIPTFGQVRYANVAPGSDLVVSFVDGVPQYSLHVAPGADPGAFRLAFRGAKSLDLDKNGDLVIATAAGEVRHRRPTIYQEADGRRRGVAGGFVLADGQQAFAVEDYDRSRPLVIDPVILVPALPVILPDAVTNKIAARGTGQVFMTGAVIAPVFPGADVADYVAGQDVFIAKFDLSDPASPTAGDPVFARYLGGGDYDSPSNIAVDGLGNSFVVGTTYASAQAFPTLNAYQDQYVGGDTDAFLFSVDDAGSLRFSTFLGGSAPSAIGANYDIGMGVALEEGPGGAATAVFVSGISTSDDFRTAVSPLIGHRGDEDAFVLKMAADGSAIDYFTYLGGSAQDRAWDIAVHNGRAYVSGGTLSADLADIMVAPLQGCLQQHCTPPHSIQGDDAFVFVLNQSGDAIEFGTYLGNTDGSYGKRIEVGADGAIYVVGDFRSVQGSQGGVVPTQFPITADAFLPAEPLFFSLFLAKISADYSCLDYATFLGGNGLDGVNDIVLDVDGVLITGRTTSGVGFAPQPPLGQYPSGFTHDALLVKFDPSQPGAAGLRYWMLLGGSASDNGIGIARDAAGTIYLSGLTESADFWPAPSVTNQPRQYLLAYDEVVAALSLTKTFVPDPLTAGDDVTFTLRIRNDGDAPATDIAVTDLFVPSGCAELQAATPTGAGLCSVGPAGATTRYLVRCTLDDLSAGDEAVVTVEATARRGCADAENRAIVDWRDAAGTQRTEQLSEFFPIAPCCWADLAIGPAPPQVQARVGMPRGLVLPVKNVPRAGTGDVEDARVMVMLETGAPPTDQTLISVTHARLVWFDFAGALVSEACPIQPLGARYTRVLCTVDLALDEQKRVVLTMLPTSAGPRPARVVGRIIGDPEDDWPGNNATSLGIQVSN